MGLNIAYIGLTLCRAIVFNIPSQLVKERIVKNRCLQLMVEKYELMHGYLNMILIRVLSSNKNIYFVKIMIILNVFNAYVKSISVHKLRAKSTFTGQTAWGKCYWLTSNQ